MPNVQQAQRGSGGFKLVAFPKEFERNFWEDLDRRFYIILLSSLAIVYGMIIFMANKEYSSQYVEDQIRAKYLKKFYEAEFVTEIVDEGADEAGAGMGEEEKEEPKEDERAKRDEGKRAEVKGQSAAERRASARAAAQRRGQQRSSMEQSIAGQGVFAELAAGGGGGSGEAVANVLGDASAGGFGNLDDVLSGVGGLQTATSSSRRSQLGARQVGGGGGSGSAGIDELIEGGIGQGGSKSIARRGDFSIKFEKGSVSGKASRATSRSSEAIGAVVNQHTDAIESCYRKESRLNPNLKGSISIQFTILANGKVAKVRIVNSTLQNRKIESCIKRRVGRWRFQAINPKEGDVTFRQKFIFSS